jgi:hypothetical protein
LKLDKQPVETTLYSLEENAPEPGGDRRAERHLRLLRVGTLVIDGRRELCLIKSISAGGMQVRAYSAIEPGTRLAIEIREGVPVGATARWAKDDCVGLSFDKQIDVLALISTSLEGPRPRMPRIEVHCTAWLREGATLHRTKALDISQGGIKVVSATELPVGVEVVVTMPGLAPIPAEIRWKDGERYGIAFHRSLGLAALVAWLQEQHRQEQARGTG